MHPSALRSLLAIVLCASFLPPVLAQPQDPAPTVLRFAPGQADVDVRGSISGYQTSIYVFDGAPGVETSVRLVHPGQASLYHNVIAPSGATIFNGSMDGDRFQARLSERGRYQVRVYLMRNDAHRGKRVDYSLRIRQSDAQAQRPAPPPASGPSFDCRRARAPIEAAVCRSPVLSRLDARLDFAYRDALAGAPPRRAAQIRRDQRRWMDDRETCAGERRLERCLTRHYRARIGQLEPKR